MILSSLDSRLCPIFRIHAGWSCRMKVTNRIGAMNSARHTTYKKNQLNKMNALFIERVMLCWFICLVTKYQGPACCHWICIKKTTHSRHTHTYIQKETERNDLSARQHDGKKIKMEEKKDSNIYTQIGRNLVFQGFHLRPLILWDMRGNSRLNQTNKRHKGCAVCANVFLSEGVFILGCCRMKGLWHCHQHHQVLLLVGYKTIRRTVVALPEKGPDHRPTSPWAFRM